MEKALITGKRGERGRGEKRKGMKERNLTGEIFLRIGPETTNFDISFNRNMTTYAAIRHVPWVLNTPKMHGSNVVAPAGRANSTPSNSLAGFKGPLQGWEKKRGRERKGREKDRN